MVVNVKKSNIASRRMKRDMHNRATSRLDKKQRYQLGAQITLPDGPIVPVQGVEIPETDAVLWVRANQGHTLQVFTELKI